MAIAIPIFTTQLEKSRESTDAANIRSAYAAATVWAMAKENTATTVYYEPGLDGSITETKTDASELGQGTKTNGNFDLSAMPKISTYDNTTDARGQVIEIDFTDGIPSTIKFVDKQ